MGRPSVCPDRCFPGAGRIDEYVLVTHPVLIGRGMPFFTALDNWVNLALRETRTFPGGVLLTRYEARH